MSRPFYVRPLAESEFARAFPLIQAIAPELSLNGWLGFARLFAIGEATAGRGIISAQDAHGYIYGLCCYTGMPNLSHRRSLVVEPFVALHVVDTVGPSAALLDALEPLARRLDCTAIELVLPRSASTDVVLDYPGGDAFRAAGYELAGIKLGRRLQASLH